MTSQEQYIHSKFGIDEVYVHQGFSHDLLEKLNQRAAFTLDGEDNIVQKHASHDMLLVFYKQVPSQSLIYRFLKFLDQYADKENFIASNTLINEDELFAAIKAKTFGLITHRTLLKDNANL